MALSNEFELLVVEHLHALSRRLANLERMDGPGEVPASPPAVGTAGRSPPETSPQEPRARAQFSLADAERLEGGNLILPCEEEPESWCICVGAAAASDPAKRAFTPAGLIRTAMPIDEFIGAAYRLILGREVDGGGLRNYQSLIETGDLPRRDFLKSLATSDEARGRGVQILIVPAPSRWLGSGVRSADASGGEPRRIVPFPKNPIGSDDVPGVSRVEKAPVTLSFHD